MKVEATRISAIAVVALAVTAGFIFPLVQKAPAQDAGLVVVITNGIKPSMEQLAPRIESSIQQRLKMEFSSSPALAKKIQSGEPFDVAILSTDVIDDLIKQGKIAAGSRTDFARTGLGVGVRAGTPKPDVSTPEALKRTLLSAKSISFNPSVASAPHIHEIFERLGIAEAVQSKLVLDAEAGRPERNVADRKAELVISLIPEVQFAEGVELAGPVPAELQSYINFSAGIAANTHNADGARALIKFLTGPAAASTLKAKGMEPR